MPPKAASATRPPSRPVRTTTRKSVSNSNLTTNVHSPPSSTNAAAVTVIPSSSTAVSNSSESAKTFTPIRASSFENISQVSPHAAAPTSQTQSQSSPKTLASNSGLINSDECSIDSNDDEDSRKTSHLKSSGDDSYEPEKIIRVEDATVVGSGDVSDSMVNMSSTPLVGNTHLQSESSVEPVTAKECAAAGVAGCGNGKRKIVRKTVRVVKKLIKKRVPKSSLANSSGNLGVVVKAEDGVNVSELRDTSNLADDVVEKSNVVDEIVEKTDEADEVLSMAHVATEKDSIFDEILESKIISDEVMQDLKIENDPNLSEPITGVKSNDLNGIAYMESDRSELNVIASSSEQMVPAYGAVCLNTMETDNIQGNDDVSIVYGNDSTIYAPDFKEVVNVGTSVKTNEIENSMTEGQLEDFIVESEMSDVVDKVDVDLVSDQNVCPVREKNEIPIGKAESGLEVESDRFRLTEGLLLSGEMEALERRKRRKTEIFVGGLDKETQEDDIKKVFEEVGAIVETRLVMSTTGKNRGFAFVRFATAADAKNALARSSKVEICGKECNVAPVEGNDTIFLGNIDRNWKSEDVVTLLEKAGIEKIDVVTLKADPDNIEKNRGFSFVEFQTCKDAQTAFNKLQKKDVFGKKQMVKVAWAQQLSEPAEEEILQVKSVYAEYLPSSWDEEKVKDYFKRFGEIENVVLSIDLPSSRRKDFAFINYTTRDAALTCVEAVNRERLENDCSKVKIAVSLAKPVSKRKQMKHTADLSSKQLCEAKHRTSETSKKQHESRNKWKAGRASYDHVKVDSGPSTTDELVQILRQQASNKHIFSHPWKGIDNLDHHSPLPGSKRPFSVLGHDPLYVDRQSFSRLHVESSLPKSGPSSTSHGVGVLSFPYHHRQAPGFTSGSVNETTYSGHFQTREEAPYYANNNDVYRRYR